MANVPATTQTTTWIPSETPGSGRLVPAVAPQLDTDRARQKLLERNVKGLVRFNRPTIIALCQEYGVSFADKATKSTLCDLLLAAVTNVSSE